MEQYQLTQQEYRNLKSRLTRAQNTKDPEKILKVAQAALDRFENVGFPDDHFRWERTKDDAKLAISRKGLPCLNLR